MNERVVREGVFGGPVDWIEIPVHQELGEGEEAEDDPIGVDFPTGEIGDVIAELIEIVRGGEVIAPFKFGDADTLFGQFGDQGEIAARILIEGNETECLAGIGALEFDGNEDDRGEPIGIGIRIVAPLELTKREVKGVDTLFFDCGAGIEIKAEEPFAEKLRRKKSLELCVGVFGGGGAAGGRSFGGLSQRWNLGAREKGKAPPLRNEDAENLVTDFILHPDDAGALRLGNGEEAVAGGQVEELFAGGFEFGGDHFGSKVRGGGVWIDPKNRGLGFGGGGWKSNRENSGFF